MPNSAGSLIGFRDILADVKRSPNSRSSAAASEKVAPKKSATKTRAAAPKAKAREAAMPPSSIEELEAALARRVAHLDAEKERLERSLAAIDAALAAEESSDAVTATPEFAAVMGIAPEQPVPAPRAKKSSAKAAASSVAAEANEKSTRASTRPAIESAPAIVKEKPVEAPKPAATVATAAATPADPGVRKPTLGSRILAILTKQHPNAMNAKQLVEKMAGSEWGVPTPIAVLQSLRALRVNGVLWSGDGETFGLTDAGRKRARAS